MCFLPGGRRLGVMAETYTSGTWIVKAGEEDAFAKEWTAFVTWGSSRPGSGTFRLIRDLERPSPSTHELVIVV